MASAHASETAGLMLAPETPAKIKTRMVIALPKMSDTSICRAVVIPPSCVKTTHPMVEKMNIKVATNSATTACRNETFETSSFLQWSAVVDGHRWRQERWSHRAHTESGDARCSARCKLACDALALAAHAAAKCTQTRAPQYWQIEWHLLSVCRSTLLTQTAGECRHSLTPRDPPLAI